MAAETTELHLWVGSGEGDRASNAGLNSRRDLKPVGDLGRLLDIEPGIVRSAGPNPAVDFDVPSARPTSEFRQPDACSNLRLMAACLFLEPKRAQDVKNFYELLVCLRICRTTACSQTGC